MCENANVPMTNKNLHIVKSFVTQIPLVVIVLCLVSQLFLLPSCKEIGPNIDLGRNIDTSLVDTTYLAATLDTVQQKRVLLEDFTGVRCDNCPKGSEQAEKFDSLYPGRMVIVGVHSGFLDSSYAGYPSMHNAQSNELENMLQPFPGKPSAGIDRVYTNNYILQVVISSWAGIVNQQLAATTPVNVYLTSTYDAATRTVKARVTLNYTANVTEANRLTVMVTEDSINAAQLQHDGSVDNNYLQRHVLRACLTSSAGETITATKEPKRVIIKEFKISPVPADWNPDRLRIVALVHHFGGTDFQVLQTAAVKAK